MPLYTFHCSRCDTDEDVLRAVGNRNDEQLHSCGAVMERKMSLPFPAIFIPTANGMALDTLNSGKAVPNRWYKSKAENLAAAGLERPEKTTW